MNNSRYIYMYNVKYKEHNKSNYSIVKHILTTDTNVACSLLDELDLELILHSLK